MKTLNFWANARSDNRIAFFVEIKPSYAYESASARASADSQMRERFDRFRETGAIHVDRLYGISALGSQICIYTYTTATQEITPPLIQQHPTYFIDVAPKERWSTDVMSHLGEQMVRGIAAQTRQMCAGMQL
ncbi:hypothetical protein FPV67DRAFT_1453790 [Lyophyllum atratum]|nr:hypothetical protein FPV67DRAFT_1453790 [Lyophyllum atratum]